MLDWIHRTADITLVWIILRRLVESLIVHVVLAYWSVFVQPTLSTSSHSVLLLIAAR